MPVWVIIPSPKTVLGWKSCLINGCWVDEWNKHILPSLYIPSMCMCVYIHTACISSIFPFMFLFEFLPLEGLQLVKSNLLIQLFLFLALRQLQKIKPQMELSVPSNAGTERRSNGRPSRPHICPALGLSRWFISRQAGEGTALRRAAGELPGWWFSPGPRFSFAVCSVCPLRCRAVGKPQKKKKILRLLPA